MNSVITLPPNHQTPDKFCLWVVKSALKGKVSSKALNEMHMHKWWLLRDFSKGSNTPEVYAFFVNIDVNRPQISQFNTAMVAWSPVPFEWSIQEKLIRLIKRTNYPNKGDVIQCISLREGVNFQIKQMLPIAFMAKDSRYLWNTMQSIGWELVAQGETWSTKINT